MKITNGIPRRCDTLQYSTAEKAIANAIDAVEAAGCHTLLTEAVVLLKSAQNKVADFVELEGAQVGGATTAVSAGGDNDLAKGHTESESRRIHLCKKCGKNHWQPIPDSLAEYCSCGAVRILESDGSYSDGPSLQKWAEDISAMVLKHPKMNDTKPDAKPAQTYPYFVDGERFDTASPTTGSQIRMRLSDVKRGYGIYLEGSGNNPDQRIEDDATVDIRFVENERFYTVPPATSGSGHTLPSEIQKSTLQVRCKCAQTAPTYPYFFPHVPGCVWYEINALEFRLMRLEKLMVV